MLMDIAKSIPGVVYQFLVGTDGSWTFPYVSDGVEDLFEVSPTEACQDADAMTLCIIDEDRPSHRKSVEYAVSNLTPWHHEHRIRTRSGKMKWILATALPRRLEDGSVLWNGILTDFTEIKESKHVNEEKYSASEEKHKVGSAEVKIREYHDHLVQQVYSSPLLHSGSINVLVIQENATLRGALVRSLEYFGYNVRGVGSWNNVKTIFPGSKADITIIAPGPPEDEGMRLIQDIREKSPCGIIVLSETNTLEMKLKLLRNGADSFLHMPVDPEEIHATIESIGRRLSPPSRPGWYFDGLRSLLITPRNIAIPLTSQQAIVLKLLTERNGESVMRVEILAVLGSIYNEHANQRLETMFSRLRAKVRSADPLSDFPLRARQSAGYAFLAPVSPH